MRDLSTVTGVFRAANDLARQREAERLRQAETRAAARATSEARG
jgi:hypothetical protein